jgi:hypothetical protein
MFLDNKKFRGMLLKITKYNLPYSHKVPYFEFKYVVGACVKTTTAGRQLDTSMGLYFYEL